MTRFERIVILGRSRIGGAIDTFRDELSTQLDGATLSIARAIPAGEFGEALGGRGITLVDQAISVTWPETTGWAATDAICGVLRARLPDIAELSQTRLVAGTVHRVHGARQADVHIAIAGRRHPDMSVDGFRHWWLNEHAPMAMRITTPPPVVYEQLHVDALLSERLSAMCAVPFEHFDLLLSAQVDRLEDFLASLSDPEIALALIQDEIGKIDHTGGGLAVVGSPLSA